MNEDHTCQAVDCDNVGIKVTVVIEPADRPGTEEIHDIYMCRMHISLQSARKGFTN